MWIGSFRTFMTPRETKQYKLKIIRNLVETTEALDKVLPESDEFLIGMKRFVRNARISTVNEKETIADSK